MEGLKNNLKEQDKRIENLQEKVNILEAQVRRESVVYFSVNVNACVRVCVCVQCTCEPVYECVCWCTRVTQCVCMWAFFVTVCACASSMHKKL